MNNKATAAFEKCGFVSVRSFKTKQPRGHKNKAALSTKKLRSAPSFIARVQQSRSDDDKLKAHVSKVAAALLCSRFLEQAVKMLTKKSWQEVKPWPPLSSVSFVL
jgi:hypothetical protein